MTVAKLRLVADGRMAARGGRRPAPFGRRPSGVQETWLRRGLSQPGGKLPLFDEFGQRINPRTIQSCIEAGWAEPWFANPIMPDWQVCRLTELGRLLVRRASGLRLVVSN